MSKSTGNLIRVKEALNEFSPDAIRLFILSSHYRSPLTVTEESFKAAEVGVQRLRQTASAYVEGAASTTRLDPEPFKRTFIESMDDDFNSAQAVAVLFDLSREINRGIMEQMDVTDARNTLIELSDILGFTLEEPAGPTLDAEPLIELLISIRSDLREAKQWQLADKIRNQLADLGIALEDTAKGTVWKHIR